MKLPCKPDHNGECLVCDNLATKEFCPFLVEDNQEEIEKIIENETKKLNRLLEEAELQVYLGRCKLLECAEKIRDWRDLKKHFIK